MKKPNPNGKILTPDHHHELDQAGTFRALRSHNTIAFQQNRAGLVLWQPDATDCVIENNMLIMNDHPCSTTRAVLVALLGAPDEADQQTNRFVGDPFFVVEIDLWCVHAGSD